MNCPSCTTAYEPEARYCIHCGGPAWFACPSCKAWAAPGDTYCTQCGETVAALDPFAKSAEALDLKTMSQLGERRIVTVMFLEVLGLAQLQQSLDPEEVTEITNRFFKKLTDVVDAWGGVIDKFLADGLMVLFGAPVAREDDADRALMTALALRETARQDMASAPAATRLGIRIGLHTGLVVAGEVGGDAKRDYTVMGDTVNLSQRMKASAAADQILATPETVANTHRDFDIEELPEIHVKGRSQPVRPQALQGLRSEHVAPARDTLPFLSRPILEHHWEATMAAGLAGRSQWLHVQGEAGMGKSRLLRRWQAALPAAGGNLIHALAGVSFQLPVPWALVKTIAPDQAPETVAADLLMASRRQPVILFVDNLDAVDAESQDWLLKLWKQIQGPEVARTLILITTSRVPILPVVGRQDVVIPPLAPSEAEIIFGAAAELSRPPAEWPAALRELAREACDQTGGNPQFLADLARDLVHHGWIIPTNDTWQVHRDGDGLPLPSSMSAILMSRLDQLPADQRTLLSVAAVAGPTLHPEMMAHLGPLAAVRQGLLSLASLGLLESKPDGSFRFTDGALHEVAYQGVLQAQRRPWHEAAAEALDQRPDMAGEKGISSLLAYHLLRAGHPEQALAHAIAAADDQEHPGGWAKTARVLRTLIATQDPPLLADTAAAWQALSALARVELRLGWHARALEHWRLAVSQAEQAREEVQAREHLARLLLERGRAEEALAVLEGGAGLTGAGYPAWWGLKARASLCLTESSPMDAPWRTWAETHQTQPDLALASYIDRPPGKAAMTQARSRYALLEDPVPAILEEMALEDLVLDQLDEAVVHARSAEAAWLREGRPDRAEHVARLAVEALYLRGQEEEAVLHLNQLPSGPEDPEDPRFHRAARIARRLTGGSPDGAWAASLLEDRPDLWPYPSPWEGVLECAARETAARAAGKQEMARAWAAQRDNRLARLLPDLVEVRP